MGTIAQLKDMAKRAIEGGERIAVSVAEDHGQAFEDVKHVRCLVYKVMIAIAESNPEYSHLAGSI